jgi:hypothetical protein
MWLSSVDEDLKIKTAPQDNNADRGDRLKFA